MNKRNVKKNNKVKGKKREKKFCRLEKNNEETCVWVERGVERLEKGVKVGNLIMKLI